MLAALILGMALIFPTALPVCASPSAAPDRLLVKPRPDLPAPALEALLSARGARTVEHLPGIGVHVVEVPAAVREAVYKALAGHPGIEFMEADALMAPEETPNDPRYPYAWHLPKIKAPAAWDRAKAHGVTVAVLDTGVNADHPDLRRVLRTGWNVVSGNTDTHDAHGHGTAIAGILAAETDNAIGVAAPAWGATILPVRITEHSDGYAYWSDLARGITWAADHGARVANASYAATGSRTVAAAGRYLKTKGGLLTVAAGNAGQRLSLADDPDLITVAATTSSDARASFSNDGPMLDVAAPGASIQTTNRRGTYSSVSGTSAAAPVAAGVLALLFAARPELTPAQAEAALERGAKDLGAAGFDPVYGWGRVDAAGAVREALER